MAFSLRIALVYSRARWKVKIRDKETREPPHATIIHGTRAWRIDLRTGEFMDSRPDPSEVPTELVNFIRQDDTWQRLRREWDRMYPNNPVTESEDEG
ncbi:MAG: hypothetical protein WDZ51_04665 [Pirellulaceae bacterium]